MVGVCTKKIISSVMKVLLIFLAGASVLALSSAVYATTGIEFNEMEAHQISAISSLIKITQAISIIIGLVLLVGSLHKFRRHGEMRGQGGGSQQSSLVAPVSMLFSGLILLYLPTVLPIMGASIVGASTSGENAVAFDVFRSLILFLRFVGLVTFIRGVLQLAKHTGEMQQQNGVLGKAFVHIIGGLLLIHMEFVANLFAGAMGFSGTISF